MSLSLHTIITGFAGLTEKPEDRAAVVETVLEARGQVTETLRLIALHLIALDPANVTAETGVKAALINFLGDEAAAHRLLPSGKQKDGTTDRTANLRRPWINVCESLGIRAKAPKPAPKAPTDGAQDGEAPKMEAEALRLRKEVERLTAANLELQGKLDKANEVIAQERAKATEYLNQRDDARAALARMQERMSAKPAPIVNAETKPQAQSLQRRAS